MIPNKYLYCKMLKAVSRPVSAESSAHIVNARLSSIFCSGPSAKEMFSLGFGAYFSFIRLENNHFNMFLVVGKSENNKNSSVVLFGACCLVAVVLVAKRGFRIETLQKYFNEWTVVYLPGSSVKIRVV